MGRKAKTPNDELDKFLLRMPDGLRARVKAAAEKNNRSMNAEIAATLEEAYPANGFDFATFMEEWMVPIVKADTAEERDNRIELANRYLLSTDRDMKLETVRGPNGKIDVILRTDGVRLLVGDAAEITYEPD